MHGRRFRRLALGVTVLAFVVVVLGAWVRLTGAGLGCPDWPGCYGRLGVPGPADAADAQAAFPDRPLDRARAWKEMAHRYAAGLLGVMILLIGVLAWRRRAPGRIPALPWFLIGLVAFQALLGMWTVSLGLAPLVVTAHLLAGLATGQARAAGYCCWRQRGQTRVSPGPVSQCRCGSELTEPPASRA